MPHREFLQIVHFALNFNAADTNLLLFDIEMPKCGPKEICLIHQVDALWDSSSFGFRRTLLLSREPSDTFPRHNVDHQYQNDLIFKSVWWTVNSSSSGAWSYIARDYVKFSYPIPYPYERMRGGVQISNIAAGITVDISIYYTIEGIDAKQLTAITIRRGTVRHARAQGPEP